MFDEYSIYLPYGYRRTRFGRTEIIHILIAVAVLTLAFGIVLVDSTAYQLRVSIAEAFGYSLGISFLVVLTGFLLHELAHKFTAQKRGAWAEFRIYPFGLILALAFAFFGFVFAAPGAVYIQGNMTRRQNGIISLSGPSTNLAIGAFFYGLWLVSPPLSIAAFVFRWVSVINLFLAVFNMIPLPPLDGSKIVRWNVPIFAVVFAITIVLLVFSMGLFF